MVPKIEIDPSNTVGQASRLSIMVNRLDSRDGCPTGWEGQSLFSMSILGMASILDNISYLLYIFHIKHSYAVI